MTVHAIVRLVGFTGEAKCAIIKPHMKRDRRVLEALHRPLTEHLMLAGVGLMAKYNRYPPAVERLRAAASQIVRRF